MKTREKIIKYLKDKGQATGAEMAEVFEISDRGIRKQLSVMLECGELIKTGRPPKVFYALKVEEIKDEEVKIDVKTKKIIEQNYFIITPGGERLEGLSGFIYWCHKQDLPVFKTAQEYIKTIGKYSVYRKDGRIDGMQKMRGTFKNSLFLDDVYYLDFYSIERFGKTKLGQMLLYAKQSQNKKLMKELIDAIKPIIEKTINKFNIDGVGFVSPTVKREVQFMSELKKRLNLKVKEIKITKIKTNIIIPQKTLNKLEDRVENAQKTFAIEELGHYKNILLIDDAIGSGATLNEIAKKLKNKGVAKKVIGLAITGSFKGFDVVSEI